MSLRKSLDEFTVQEGPALGNQYTGDVALRHLLQHLVPAAALADMERDLVRFGGRVAADIKALGDAAEANPPTLTKVAPFGRPRDSIVTHPAWEELVNKVSPEEGLVAIGYERRHGEWSRVHQFAKLYLYAPSSAVADCPLAMTDGAARLLEVLGERRDVFEHLTSRDPGRFWTSGQWMTERNGGSDLSRSETVAVPNGDGTYSLHGVKYFTSAATSECTFTLARIQGADTPAGSRGLSCFYLETRDRDGELNKIEVLRLKPKLGTRALPTAELFLKGTPATLVGKAHRGVPTIATLFNVTRVYNAISAVGYMRRCLALAEDYAYKRRVFGKLLAEQPLHLRTLAEMQVDFRGSLHFAFDVVATMGRAEVQKSPVDEALLRGLTPLLKLFTGKLAVALASETVEMFGGVGYCEDTGIPAILRNAQVLSVWEGTTNVLSMDFVRAISGRGNVLPTLVSHTQTLIGRSTSIAGLTPAWTAAKRALAAFEGYVSTHLGGADPDIIVAGARDMAYGYSRIYMLAVLLAFAAQTQTDNDAAVALQWAERHRVGPDMFVVMDAGQRDANAMVALNKSKL